MDAWRELIHSKANYFLWKVRNQVKFRRRGYREENESSEVSLEHRVLCNKYGIEPIRTKMSAATFSKNMATLYILEQLWSGLPKPHQILEAGAQDFNRLPALAAFFKCEKVTGLEIDAYPVLANLHSRFDKAHYYQTICAPMKIETSFICDDFFKYQQRADAILAFYPFVSANPALAWGLPAEFGNAEKWIQSLLRCLPDHGHALVIHQGKWEEETFDQALTKFSSLKLLKRQSVDCPFYPLPYEALGSVYQKQPISN